MAVRRIIRRLMRFVGVLFGGLLVLGAGVLALVLAIDLQRNYEASGAGLDPRVLFFLGAVVLLAIGAFIILFSFVLLLPEGKPEALIAALNDGDPRRRAAAAMELGDRLEPQAVQPLISSLEDPHPHVRVNAAISLGDLRDPRAVEPLIALLTDDHPFVRATAAEMLGKIGDARALQPLVAALADPSPWSLPTALANMPRAGQLLPGRKGPLIRSYKQPCVQAAAAAALARIRRVERPGSAQVLPPSG
jgi:hypothetical protein